MKTTLYQLLGVEPNAKQPEIDTAYVAQTEKYNAQREQGNAEASNQLLFLKDAYAILSDPARRGDYDKKLANALNRANLQANAKPPGNFSTQTKDAEGQSTRISGGTTTLEASAREGAQEGRAPTKIPRLARSIEFAVKHKIALMSLSILVIIALAVLLIAGYSQKIEGEAFVVTKGRDTIKLSLLEIFIIPTDKFEQYKVDYETVKLPAIKNAENAIIELNKRRELLELEIESLNRDLTSELDKVEMSRRMEESISIMAKIVHVKRTLNNTHDTIARQRTLARQLKDSIFTGLKEIKDAVAHKTDSNGRFTFTTNHRSFVIVAEATRAVVGEAETYRWLLVNPKLPVSLNNDNLLKSQGLDQLFVGSKKSQK